MLNKKQDQKGFTIIEVLIVLAIAALILIIIFFAVPALQRNNRNTQIRNDVAVLLGYLNDYAATNNGGFPGGGFYNTSNGSVCLGATAPTACADSSATGYVGNIRGGLVVTFRNITTGTGTQPTNTATIDVNINARCNGNVAGAFTNRTVAAGFQVETAGTPANQCQQS